jgi:hypothetical protein
MKQILSKGDKSRLGAEEQMYLTSYYIKLFEGMFIAKVSTLAGNSCKKVPPTRNKHQKGS